MQELSPFFYKSLLEKITILSNEFVFYRKNGFKSNFLFKFSIELCLDKIFK